MIYYVLIIWQTLTLLKHDCCRCKIVDAETQLGFKILSWEGNNFSRNHHYLFDNLIRMLLFSNLSIEIFISVIVSCMNILKLVTLSMPPGYVGHFT